MSIDIIGKKAKTAAKFLNSASQNLKNEALLKIADALVKNIDVIIENNKKITCKYDDVCNLLCQRRYDNVR